MISFFTNLYTLKYLYDVKKNNKCEKINSYDFQLLFDTRIAGLLLFCFLLLVIQYFLRSRNKNLKNQTYIKFFTDNEITFKLFGVFICGIMITILYDIGKEPQCKDIDIFMRNSLYYLNIVGFFINTISILLF
mgnify:CR=1 FL=1|jgi:hypothetical protein